MIKQWTCYGLNVVTLDNSKPDMQTGNLYIDNNSFDNWGRLLYNKITCVIQELEELHNEGFELMHENGTNW